MNKSNPDFLCWVALILMLPFFGSVADTIAAEPRWKLTAEDNVRIEKEIEAFGLADAPRIADAEAAAALPADTKILVVTGGGKETLESLGHLENLESLYLILGEITEVDLAALSNEIFPNLKRLTLGMAGLYRLQHDLWEPVGKLTTLEQLDVRCHD